MRFAKNAQGNAGHILRIPALLLQDAASCSIVLFFAVLLVPVLIMVAVYMLPLVASETAQLNPTTLVNDLLNTLLEVDLEPLPTLAPLLEVDLEPLSTLATLLEVDLEPLPTLATLLEIDLEPLPTLATLLEIDLEPLPTLATLLEVDLEPLPTLATFSTIAPLPTLAPLPTIELLPTVATSDINVVLVVQVEWGNVRAGPGVNHDIIGLVKAGDVIDKPLGQHDNGWYRFCCIDGNKPGWVAPSLVKVQQQSDAGSQKTPTRTPANHISITHPPGSLDVSPIYQKYMNASGAHILALSDVSDQAMIQARDILYGMVSTRPDLLAAMTGTGLRIIIF